MNENHLQTQNGSLHTDSEPTLADLTRQIQSLHARIEDMHLVLQALLHLQNDLSSCDREKVIRKIEKGLSEGNSYLNNALTGDANTLSKDANALTGALNTITGETNAFSDEFNAFTGKPDALAGDVNAHAGLPDASSGNANALTIGAKLTTKKAKSAPWKKASHKSYKASSHRGAKLAWRQEISSEMVVILQQQTTLFGKMRPRGLQSVAALYLVLFHQSPLLLADMSRRLRLHEGHIKKYLKLLKNARHIHKYRKGAKQYFELSAEGKQWLESHLQG